MLWTFTTHYTRIPIERKTENVMPVFPKKKLPLHFHDLFIQVDRKQGKDLFFDLEAVRKYPWKIVKIQTILYLFHSFDNWETPLLQVKSFNCVAFSFAGADYKHFFEEKLNLLGLQGFILNLTWICLGKS